MLDVQVLEVDAVAEQPKRPLWHHAAALLVLLIVLIPIVGTHSAVNTDESYVVIQLDVMQATGQWLLPHPFPEVDPSGNAFPLHGASRYDSGYTLYDKHPALIYMYQPIHRILGLVGLVGMSVLGTWGAALVSALIAGRLRPGSAVTALWLAGIGSPLFFGAYQIHAHTIAAALAAVVTYLALRVIDDDRAVLIPLALAAAVALTLLRTEGVLFVGAAGAAVGLFGLLDRRFRSMALGASLVLTGAATVVLDRAWSASIAPGDALPFASLTATSSYLEGRVQSLSFTLLMPGYRGGTVPEILTMTGAIAVIVGTTRVCRATKDRNAWVLPTLGAGLLAVRSALEWGPIPGLVIAFCVGIAGLSLLGGELARSHPTRFVMGTCAVFVAAVAATQYAGGGSTEWGGRYFALCVPLLAAVAAASLRRAFAGMPAVIARRTVVALCVASVALALLAVSSVRQAHDRNRGRTDGVLAAAAQLPPPADGGSPVVLTDDAQLPRLARGRYSDVRFLRVEEAEIGSFLHRLAGERIEDALIVWGSRAAAMAALPADWEVVGPVLSHDLQYEPGGALIRVRRTDG